MSVANKRLSAMNALDAPTKIIEDRMSLEVRKIDNKVTIVWDPSILKGDGRPVEGLVIKAAPALLEAARLRNGNSEVAEQTSNAPITDSGAGSVDAGDGGEGE